MGVVPSLLYVPSGQAGDSCRGVDRRVQPDGRGGAHAQDCPGCGAAARRRQGFGSGTDPDPAFFLIADPVRDPDSGFDDLKLKKKLEMEI